MKIVGELKKLGLFGAVIIAMGAVSCGTQEEIESPESEITEDLPGSDEAYAEIKTLHDEMTNPDGSFIKSKSNELYDLAVIFIDRFPEDERRWRVMDYGQTAATGIGKLKDADRIMERMLAEYPDHPERSEKMSLRAQHLYYKLNDQAAARVLYEQIIEEFPDTEWAVDAKGNLRIMDAEEDLNNGELPDFFEKPTLEES